MNALQSQNYCFNYFEKLFFSGFVTITFEQTNTFACFFFVIKKLNSLQIITFNKIQGITKNIMNFYF